jgi:REP element-mobilizing transposase RayT
VHHRRLLDTDAKRTMVRDVLKAAIRKYGVRLYAWVVLADRYHLLLKTGSLPIYKFIKRLHGESAIRLNKLDGVPGRKVWYQYWDRFPRNVRDFGAYLNYIHINPVKHGYVRALSDDILIVEGKRVRIAPERVLDVHQCLARYPHSSYHYYRRVYGEAFLTDAWMCYPIPDYFEHDSF